MSGGGILEIAGYLGIGLFVLFCVGLLLRNRQRSSSAPRSDTAPGIPAGTKGTLHARSSAKETTAVTTSLLASQAMWPEILASLNPDGDAEVARVLLVLRGPHMFAPHTALQVLLDGCAKALRVNPAATHLAALLAAQESMEEVTRFGR